MKALWPNQARGLAGLRPDVEAGGKRDVVTAPTGGGKTRMMHEILTWGYPSTLYTNRTMLYSQLAEGLTDAGFHFGHIAPGREPDPSAPIQLAMIPTVHQRMKRPAFALPDSRVVLVDECHNEKGERMAQILRAHVGAGATAVGFSATPVDLGDLYDTLIVAGTNSELRECGAHLPAYTYAPSEIDTKMVRRVKVMDEEFATPEYRQAVFGSVLEHYLQLNPNRTPTILFAPGVKESLWIAEHFAEAGITAAHIDGERVWVDGEQHASTEARRDEIKRRVASGEIQVVCNRFVLREGIDIPELQHLIFATPFKSLAAYLQAGGRVLRAHPSHRRVTIQDHGGNWWRLGSLNADREWFLDRSDRQHVADWQDAQRKSRNDGVPEPIVCPQCTAIRTTGASCHKCGYMAMRGVRNVIQHDGQLRAMRGDIYRPRKVSTKPEDQRAWESIYWRMRNAKTPKTFSQAIGFFRREHHADPDPSWRYMPKSPSDRARRIKDVPVADLHGEQREAVA